MSKYVDISRIREILLGVDVFSFENELEIIKGELDEVFVKSQDILVERQVEQIYFDLVETPSGHLLNELKFSEKIQPIVNSHFIPKTIEYIGKNTFSISGGLKQANFNSSSSNFIKGRKYLFLSSFKFGENIKIVGDGAFKGQCFHSNIFTKQPLIFGLSSFQGAKFVTKQPITIVLRELIPAFKDVPQKQGLDTFKECRFESMVKLETDGEIPNIFSDAVFLNGISINKINTFFGNLKIDKNGIYSDSLKDKFYLSQKDIQRALRVAIKTGTFANSFINGIVLEARYGYLTTLYLERLCFENATFAKNFLLPKGTVISEEAFHNAKFYVNLYGETYSYFKCKFEESENGILVCPDFSKIISHIEGEDL